MFNRSEDMVAAAEGTKDNPSYTVPAAAMQTGQSSVTPPQRKNAPNQRTKHGKCKKTKKPKDMPRRPLSAYNIFFREERVRILFQNGSTHNKGEALGTVSSLFSSLGKEVAKRWKTLNEQEHAEYAKMARNEMVRYRNEIDEYHIGQARQRRLEQNQLGNLVNLEYVDSVTARHSNSKSDSKSHGALSCLALAATRERAHHGPAATQGVLMFDNEILSSSTACRFGQCGSSNRIETVCVSNQQNYFALDELLLNQLRRSEHAQEVRQLANLGSFMGLDSILTLQMLQFQQLHRLEHERQMSSSQSFPLEIMQINQSTKDLFMLMSQSHQASNLELGSHRSYSQRGDTDSILLGLPIIPRLQFPL
jgi:HMG-box domain